VGAANTMKAFLSHSSLDKGYVRQVYEKLGQGLAEYDERTFDLGALNVAAMGRATDMSSTR
jgi:hypothetical protein